ncbi:MAG: Rrf2 family transcriptional regulator [Clostridiaceae bacterium]|nr:Rrf2 family transcriptional regulator [Clostridiaceae bacterium]
MKLSAKGRYGLASMICLAQEYGKDDYITIASISEKLGVSKIYLEQVFALLKRANLVESTKGSSGGYQLATSPKNITVYDILSAIEQSLFEKSKKSLSDSASNIENAIGELVLDRIDEAILKVINSVTLYDLCEKANSADDNLMYYI